MMDEGQVTEGGEPTAPFRDRERGGVALLIVDLINRFDFEGGDELKAALVTIAPSVLRLRDMVDTVGAPTIYVNDNFGEWHSEKSKLVEQAQWCGDEGNIVNRLAPRTSDYFVIKPQLSGFYATNLPVLLPKLGVSQLIITGVAAEMCVLFTAADAHMRDYSVWVPEDAVASSDGRLTTAALTILRKGLGVETAPTVSIDVAEWLQASGD